VTTPYQRGTAFEHRVKGILEKEGWLVTRSPKSGSPYDLMAIKLSHWPILVQCKLRGRMTIAAWGEIADLALKHGAKAIHAYKLPRGKEVHFECLPPSGDGRLDLTAKVDWTP
jgi:Holliday junction resolvase